MPEFQRNLWAPWRMDYIDSLNSPAESDCFLCNYRDHPADDAKNFVLWRTQRTLVLLNRFPYSSGHLLLAPLAHGGALADASVDVLHELTLRIRDAQRALQRALGAEGFNIGMNLGRCAGAGLPDHLHWHIVPRWSGDVNFMPAVGDVKVIPQSLERVRDQFVRAATELGMG